MNLSISREMALIVLRTLTGFHRLMTEELSRPEDIMNILRLQKAVTSAVHTASSLK